MVSLRLKMGVMMVMMSSKWVINNDKGQKKLTNVVAAATQKSTSS
jgi:hypothetical protein